MGNELTSNPTFYDDKSITDQSKLSKFIKSKLQTFTYAYSKTNIYEDFIIKHKRFKQNNDNAIDTNSIDQRRLVFVSLIGLFQTWKNTPCYLLHSALIIIPLKRKWVYQPSKYMTEIKSTFVSNISTFSADTSETKQFIQLLKWKDTQGLVFWMLDDYTQQTSSNTLIDPLIDPFWLNLNKQLTKLYDPITKSNYKSLNLNCKYWQTCDKFDTKRSSIMCELYFLTMKYKTIQEIIYDSNPTSLNPIKSYGERNFAIANTSNNESMSELLDEFINDNEKENWWVSRDYDPYDMDEIML